jgi:hypothetical protein
VPGAADVQVEVMRPDGGVFPAVTCTSSPCTVQIDGRQTTHLFRLTYRNPSGAVLSRGDWHELAASATFVDVPEPSTVSYARQGKMTVYVAPKGMIDAMPFTMRSVDYFVGSGEYNAKDPDILPRNKTGRHVTYSLYNDLATFMPHHEFQILRNTPELGNHTEQAFAHMWVNHDAFSTRGQTRNNALWTNMDRFGIEEISNLFSGTAGQNGVVLSPHADSPCAGDCVDRSAQAYSTAAADVALTAARPYLLIGYGQDFDEVNTVVATPQAGCSVKWQYRTASGWADLSSFQAGYNHPDVINLRASGRLRFTPPADWAQSIQSGTWPKPWIRVGVSGCTTYPVLSRVFGDNWRVHEMPAADRKMWNNTMLAAADGEQFSSLTINITVPRTLTAVYQYSRADGSWGNLTLTSSTSQNNFSSTGTRTIAWSIPGDWAAFDHSGSGVPKKWIRVTGTGGDEPPVVPVVSTFTIGGGTTTQAISTASGRGWDPRAPGVIRAGTNRAYNPNPPDHASARFEYQARAIITFWASSLGNIAAGYNLTKMAPDGIHRAASYMFLHHFDVKEARHDNRHNAYFFDNVNHDHGVNRLASPTAAVEGVNADHSTGTNAHIGFIGDFVALMAKRHPDMRVGGNGTTPNLTQCKLMNFCGEEGFFNYTSVHSFNFKSTWEHTMDPIIQGGNPKKSDVSITCSNIADRAKVSGGTQKLRWDKAGRGTMMCLAGYYQGANDHTRFTHSASSPFAYDTTTEVFLKGSSVQVSQSVDHNATQICSDAFAVLPVATTAYRYWHEGSGMFNLRKDAAGSCMTLATPSDDWLVTGINKGDELFRVTSCHLGLCMPRQTDGVLAWTFNFPAMGIDVGRPATARMEVPAARYGTKRPLFWRPYDKAVMLNVLASAWEDNVNDYNSRANIINFAKEGWCEGAGCKLYPLRPDGYTDNSICPASEQTADGGCTGYAPMRVGDGQVFMREAVQ